MSAVLGKNSESDEKRLAKIPRRLVIFTGVVHHFSDGNLKAHGGFVREVDVWARIFREVLVVSPASYSPPKADAIPYAGDNVHHLTLCRPTNTDGVAGKLRLMLNAPRWLYTALKATRNDDVIMARGPDSIGFLGVLVGRLRRARRFAKYAEQWTPFPDEPVGYRIQRWVYGSRLFGAPVQVYIPPDRQGKNLVPFFPSVIGREQWDRYSGIATTRTYVSPFRLLFAGRLVSGKGVDIAVQALRHVLDKNFDVVLDIVGDGPERTATERLVNSLGIADRTRFYGWVGWSDLERLYARAHVFVHCSRKEGFGKVIVEAMAFGLPVVATDVGLCRWILDPPMCGLVVPPDNPEEIAHAVCRILSNPEEARAMGLRGRERSAQWLLESLEDHYRTFLKKHLALPM